MTKSKEIQLAARPNGMPAHEHFNCVEVDVPSLNSGEVLVRNAFMSVDPYMRGRMTDRASYVPPFQIGKVLEGGAVGEVVASEDSGLKSGDFVSHMKGWREYAVCVAKECTVLPMDTGAPLQAFLGALGMPGMTAYVGLMRVGALKDGEIVFISAASGAVGATACQIAKAKGCFVVGSAGSDEKCAWLRDDIGIDATINYKTCGNLNAALHSAAPEGIDIYFENVGGAHLQAAIEAMRPSGRLVMCGMISQYNDTAPSPGPNNLILVVGKSLRMEGFIVSNHMDMFAEFSRDMTKWIGEGKMHWRETILEGIDQAPQAFMNLFTGANKGKMLVRF